MQAMLDAGVPPEMITITDMPSRSFDILDEDGRVRPEVVRNIAEYWREKDKDKDKDKEEPK